MNQKNPAAVALGKLRAKTITPEERSAGGLARAASLTPEERSKIAKKAVAARIKKHGQKKKSSRRKPNPS